MDRILPSHVGVIMDGNRRWAKDRKLSSFQGHQEGLMRAKEIVKFSSEIGIKYLSLYVFSTENWKRTQDEVSHLMFLIAKYLKAEFDFYKKNKIRIMVSGDLEKLNSDVKFSIKETIDFTSEFDGLTVNLAINYGGRDEIIRAIKKLPSSSLSTLDENEFSKYLDNSELPDLDLLIRTGGDIRISNFLLWRLVYAEFVFSNDLWPDYTSEKFSKALNQFEIRKRNFGR